MRAIKPAIFLFSACLITLNLRSQADAILNYLPTGAKMIFKINPASLGQKIKWEDVTKYKLFGELVKEFPSNGKEFLNNPSHTGIDMQQGIFLVILPNKSNEKPDPVFYAFPKDTAQITEMVKKLFPGKRPVRVGSNKILVDKHTALAWNNEVIILTGDDAKKDSANKTATTSPAAESARIRELTARMKMLIAKRRAPWSNESFTSLISRPGDILLWTDNTQRIQPKKNSKVPQAFGMINKNFVRKGDYSATIINFENGKVEAEMRQRLPLSLDSIYQKYPARNINTDLLKKLPNAHPIFLWSFSFSPQMMTENLVKSGADKMLDSSLGRQEGIEDLLAAIRGDFVIGVLKTDVIDADDSVTKKMGGIEVFAAGGINDKEKFQKIGALLQDQKKDSSKNNSSKKPRPSVLSNDSIFVVSPSSVAAQKFLNAPGNNDEIAKTLEPYKKNASAMVIELQTIFGFLSQSMLKNKSEEEVKKASDVLGMFDKMISYGGQEGHVMSNNFELTLSNKDENSLKQFLNLLDLFYSLKNKKSLAYN